MSIKDIQTKKLINKILLEELQSGVVPSINTIQRKAYEHFQENNLGMPMYNGYKVDRRSTTKPSKYNEALNNIEYDLNVLFESIVYKNHKVIKDFIEEEMNRNQILSLLNEVQEKEEELVTVSQNTNTYNQSYDFNFNTFNKYDPKSTALIDLDYNNVKLDMDLMRSSQHYIDNIRIDKVEPYSVDQESITDISHCINDYQNKTWMHKVTKHNDDVEDIRVGLFLELDSTSMTNQIELFSNTRDITHIDIQVSNDRENWRSIENATGQSSFTKNITYYFEKQPMKYVYITLAKSFNENDQDETFLFSINNISLYNRDFNTKGYLESNSINIPASLTIDKINLEADERLPNNTSIDYTIEIDGQDYNINPINRDVSEDSKTIHLNTTNKYIDELDEVKEKERRSHLDNYNIRFYRLEKLLPDSIIPEETKVYKGVNQWHKSVYQFFRDRNYRISINDYINKPVRENSVTESYVDSISNNDKITEPIEIDADVFPLKYQYVDNDSIKVFKYNGNTKNEISPSDYSIEDYSTQGINTKIVFNNTPTDSLFVEYYASFMNYKFTKYIYSESNQTSKTNEIPSLAYQDDSFEFSTLYVNNRRIAKNRNEGTHSYDIYLHEGWNKIDYIFYSNESEMSNYAQNNLINIIDNGQGIGIASAITGADANSIISSKHRGRRKPLKYKGIYDLQNKILTHEHDYFSLDRTNNGYNIIINNHEPAYYTVSYTTKEYNYNNFKLKIDLETNDNNLTPVVNNAKVNMFYN